MIRLTKLTDYGLVVMTHFANNLERRIWNARDVASAVHLPVPTVSKLLKAFAKGGLLKAHRGVHGGYSLGKPPEEITLPRIVEVLEGPVAITECQQGGETDCLLQLLCPLRPTWADLNDAIKSTLESVTLAELARKAAMHSQRIEAALDAKGDSPNKANNPSKAQNSKFSLNTAAAPERHSPSSGAAKAKHKE
ncbi:MAG: SUF system Fe-S cluster assembly regulator [Candidatus Sumerlaeaceae bacterium]